MSYDNLTFNFKTIRSDTKYIQILRYIKDNPLKTRDEINKAIFGFANRGYMSDYYAHMIVYELVDCCRAADDKRIRVYKITELGEKTIKQAEMNGAANRKTHKIKIPSICKGYHSWTPLNYQLPEDRPALEALARVLQKTVNLGAYCDTPLCHEASLHGSVKKEQIDEIIGQEPKRLQKKIWNLIDKAGLMWKWRANSLSNETTWFVTFHGLDIINYCNSLGSQAKKVMAE